MTLFRKYWIRLMLSIFAVLAVNILILFVIPPVTPLGTIVKDLSSLIVGVFLYCKFLRD